VRINFGASLNARALQGGLDASSKWVFGDGQTIFGPIYALSSSPETSGIQAWKRYLHRHGHQSGSTHQYSPCCQSGNCSRWHYRRRSPCANASNPPHRGPFISRLRWPPRRNPQSPR